MTGIHSHAFSINMDRIRKARSIQDLQRITASIMKEVSSCSKSVRNLNRSASRLVVSLSLKTSLSAKGDLDEIKISHTGVGQVNRVNVGKPLASAPVSTHLAGFKPPKLLNVKQHTDTINNLYDKSLELDSVEALLIQSFAGSKGQPAAVKAIRALKKTVDQTLNEAFTSLAKISDASLPKELKALGDNLTTYLINNLEKESYSDMTESSYVFRTKDGMWHYAFYVTLADLKNESGFVFEDYNVVLSAIIDKAKHATYYLTTLSDFKIPGKFPPGKVVKSSADIKNILGIMLRHNDVINVLDKKALPLNTEDARSNGLAGLPGVKDASVDDDTLILKLIKKNTLPADISKIVHEVLPMLNLLTGNKSKRMTPTWKLVKGTSGSELQFILVSAVKGDKTGSINIEKLKDLQHAMDLSDDEVKAIKDTLKNSHR